MLELQSLASLLLPLQIPQGLSHVSSKVWVAAKTRFSRSSDFVRWSSSQNTASSAFKVGPLTHDQEQASLKSLCSQVGASCCDSSAVFVFSEEDFRFPSIVFGDATNIHQL